MTAEEVYRKKYGLPKRPTPQPVQQTPSVQRLVTLLQDIKEDKENAK